MHKRKCLCHIPFALNVCPAAIVLVHVQDTEGALRGTSQSWFAKDLGGMYQYDTKTRYNLSHAIALQLWNNSVFILRHFNRSSYFHPVYMSIVHSLLKHSYLSRH